MTSPRTNMTSRIRDKYLRKAPCQHGYNVILRHSLEMHRTDFAFCFYAVYVQRRLLLLILLLLLLLILQRMVVTADRHTTNSCPSKNIHDSHSQQTKQNHRTNTCISRTQTLK
jgi:hypothetical protein